MTDSVSQLFCSNCGAANSSEDTHCTFCQRSLTQTSPSQALADASSLIHGRYEILAELGSGGYSSVYKARDTLQQRVVALKAITLRNLSAQEMIEATDTFNREWQILARLRHPQLPNVYDHFNDAEHWYLAVEFMEGETLEAYMQKHTSGLPVTEVLEIGIQLCEVLSYLHHSKPPVIFRDLKPGNVMLSPNGGCSLIDFGIARHFQPDKKRDTLPLGSPGFASPEQYGKSQTTPRSDIYSLGALLHFLITGNDPSEQAFHFEPLRLYGEGLWELNVLIQLMIALDPQQRPESIQKVKEELERIGLLLLPQKYQPARQNVPQRLPRLSWQSPTSSGSAGGSTWQSPSSSRKGYYGGKPIWRQDQQQQQQQQVFAPTPQKPDLGRRRAIGAIIAGAAMLAGIWLYGTKHTIDNTTTSSTPTQEPASTETPSSTEVSQEVAAANLLYSARLYKDGDLEVVSLPGQVAMGRFSTGVSHPYSTDLYWSPDDSRIAVIGDYQTCQVWDIKSGQQIINRNNTNDIFSLAWSPDGKRIAISGGYRLSIWSAQDGTVIYEHDMEDYDLEIDNLVWSPDGAYLAFSDQRYYYDRDNNWTVRIWDVAGRKQVGQFSGSFIKQDTKTMSQLSWSSDGAWMVVMDGERVWRFQPHKPGSLSEFTRVSKSDEFIDLAWSPD
ncbi:MAG: protein kinase, partial [Ktedonobacteraceae bacterium]|nr:protein kinase [Ktedonobacteraceae bacterium]